MDEFDKEDFEDSEIATGGRNLDQRQVEEVQEQQQEEEMQAVAGAAMEAEREAEASLLDDYGVSEEDREAATQKLNEYMREYGMTREQAADLVNLDYIAETGRDLGGGEGYGAQDLRESSSRAESFLRGFGSGARGQTSGATQQTTQRLPGMLGVGREAGFAQIAKERRRAAATAARQAKILGSVQKAQIDRLRDQQQSVAGTVFGGLLGGAVGLALVPLLGPGAGMAAKALLVAGASKVGGDVGGSI